MAKKRNKMRSQAFSMDIMLAVIIFIGTVFFFYAILSNTQGSKADELQSEASKVLADLLSNPGLKITDGNMINATKLEEFLGNYSGLKGKLKANNDFCIYFEDEDGNVMFINSTHTGIGSATINVSNIPCG